MSDDGDRGGSDRRAVPRRPVVRAALAIFADGAQPMPCVLLDLSGSGARLNVHRADGFPDAFRLTVASETIDRFCRVIWRRGEEVGVVFED